MPARRSNLKLSNPIRWEPAKRSCRSPRRARRRGGRGPRARREQYPPGRSSVADQDDDPLMPPALRNVSRGGAAYWRLCPVLAVREDLLGSRPARTGHGSPVPRDADRRCELPLQPPAPMSRDLGHLSQRHGRLARCAPFGVAPSAITLERFTEALRTTDRGCSLRGELSRRAEVCPL